MPSCRLSAAGAHPNGWRPPGLNYKLSLAGRLPPPLYFCSVPPSEAPLQAIYGALFLGKLITGAQPGHTSPHRVIWAGIAPTHPINHEVGRGHPQSSPTRAPHALSHRSIRSIILIVIALDFSPHAANRHPLQVLTGKSFDTLLLMRVFG